MSYVLIVVLYIHDHAQYNFVGRCAQCMLIPIFLLIMQLRRQSWECSKLRLKLTVSFLAKRLDCISVSMLVYIYMHACTVMVLMINILYHAVLNGLLELLKAQTETEGMFCLFYQYIILSLRVHVISFTQIFWTMTVRSNIKVLIVSIHKK